MLLLAIAIDLVFSEPPRAIHPVVWAGKLIESLSRQGLKFKPRVQLIYGIFLVFIVLALFVIPVFFFTNWLVGNNSIAFIIAGAIILKPTFCLKQQWVIAQSVKVLLENWREGTEPAELKVLFTTVSREGKGLSKQMVISATLRSLAENAVDFFVAPLFYFILFGIPGALAYRIVNTLDSMVGFHGKYEYLGKFAARLDDILSYIPARITAVLIILAAFAARGDSERARKVSLKEHSETQSPNAGWPMAAMSGALGVKLKKEGHYTLGQGLKYPNADSIGAGVRLFRHTAFYWTVFTGLIIVIIGVI